jgi:hypothetical protein
MRLSFDERGDIEKGVIVIISCIHKVNAKARNIYTCREDGARM